MLLEKKKHIQMFFSMYSSDDSVTSFEACRQHPRNLMQPLSWTGHKKLYSNCHGIRQLLKQSVYLHYTVYTKNFKVIVTESEL